MSRERRIAKELRALHDDPESGIFLQPAQGDDITHLVGSFAGPRDTPYEGGRYLVDIKIPVCSLRRFSCRFQC